MSQSRLAKFTAERARKLVEEANSKNSLIVQKVFEIVKQKIIEKAKNGEQSLLYPFDRIDKNGDEKDMMPYDRISEDKKMAVVKMFTENGFKWNYKPSQDPGSQMDRPLEEFKW